jgi:hypothetical protein
LNIKSPEEFEQLKKQHEEEKAQFEAEMVQEKE